MVDDNRPADCSFVQLFECEWARKRVDGNDKLDVALFIFYWKSKIVLRLFKVYWSFDDKYFVDLMMS